MLITILGCILAGLIVLYLLAIMPRMIHKPDTTPLMGVLYAHRGLHDNKTDAPENSMKAFRLAAEAGFGIELDIQLSRDGIPVVFHDFTLQRACGTEGKVNAYSYDELQKFSLFQSEEKIPTLEEVLREINGRVPLIVEFKIEWTDTSLCPIADKLLSAYQGPYCMESFNPLALLWYRKNKNHVVRGQLSDAFISEQGMKGILYFALEHLFLNCITKPDFIAYNHNYFYTPSRQLCKQLYRCLSVAYTIRSQEELEKRRRNFHLFIFDSFLPEIDKS